MTLLIGWMLGIFSALGAELFVLWGVGRDIHKKNDPPTKEEWKVM